MYINSDMTIVTKHEHSASQGDKEARIFTHALDNMNANYHMCQQHYDDKHNMCPFLMNVTGLTGQKNH